MYHFSWKIHAWGITLPNPTPFCTSPVPRGATADIADRRSPSTSAECPENHTEFPKTLLSDCPLTHTCWQCNAYALGARRVHVDLLVRTQFVRTAYVLRGMAAGWSRGMCMFPTFRNRGFKPLHTHCVCIAGRNRKTRGPQRTRDVGMEYCRARQLLPSLPQSHRRASACHIWFWGMGPSVVFKMRVLTFSPACTCKVGPRISVTAVCSSAIRSHLLVLPSCWYSLNGGIFLEWGGEKIPRERQQGGGCMETTRFARIGTSATLHTYVCAYESARQRVRVSFLMRTFHNSESYVS